MKAIKLGMIVIMFSLLSACTSTETVLSNSDSIDKGVAQKATVTNIRQITLDADWQDEFTGAALGMAIGQLVADDTGGVAGLFIGGDIANEMNGKVVDEITLTDQYGNNYTGLVPENSFNFQQKVLFTHHNGKLTAVSK